MLDQNNPVLVQAVRQVAEKRSDEPRRKFRATYWRDPVAFVHDCFIWRPGESPTKYQDEIMAALPKYHRVSARGGRGFGKSALCSWLILWFALTRDGEDWKVPTTAGAWRQLIKFLWPEVHKWARRLNWNKIPRPPFDTRTELLSQNLKLWTGEAFASSSDKQDLIEGAHADYLLYILDECKVIPDKVFDSVEGSLTGGGFTNNTREAFVIAVSTPGDRIGRFFDIQRHGPGYDDWWVRHVKLEEVIEAGILPQGWVEQRKKQWGVGSPVFQSQVLGEFPEQGSDMLINLSWVEAARQNELVPAGPKISGVDVARWGDDSSVQIVAQDCKRKGQDEIITGGCIIDLEAWNGNDLMQTTGRVKAKGIYANIDTIGMGAGVYDRLQEQGFGCNSINVGSSADDSEHFFNLRAELYWQLREDFREGRIDLTRLDQDSYDRLQGELTNIKYEYTSKGQIKIEPKDDIKKRAEGQSPDFADALMLTRSGRDTSIGIHVI